MVYHCHHQLLQNAVLHIIVNPYVKNWFETLNYRIYKENVYLEKYFNSMEDTDMFTLCKFEMVNHKLPIEL